METHEIRYFLAMVRELNFTRAATACGITQPALTRAIQKLEVELGGALFLRRPGQIELTRLAREILSQLEAIEQGMAAVKERAQLVSETRASSLRLGVMCTVGPAHLVAILGNLRAAIADLELTIVDAKSSQIVELIASDEIDVGIAAWPTYPACVRAETLLRERYSVAMREDDPLARGTAVELARLAGQSYVDRLGCEFDDYYEALYGKWTIDLDVSFASEREDWIQALLLAGFGYAIVPELMEMPPGIAKRVLSEPEVAREVAVVTLRGKPLPAAAAAFVRLAKSHRWRAEP